MSDRANHAGQRSPWMWIPTLYIAEGLPYFAVNTLAVVMYTRMGVGLTEMAFFTGWLYLPWVIKPFWSPFIDIFGTRRRWIVAMQFCIGVSMALVALCLPLSFFFAATLAAFWLMAFFSATHDIAADGYYMLALTPKAQAAYVGVRNTFYRIASLIGQGGMVWLAGEMEERTGGNIPYAWAVTFGVLSITFMALSIYHTLTMPRPHNDRVSRPDGVRGIMREFGETFVTFFKKRHITTAIAFMLLYRLAEALMLKVSGPFLLAAPEDGGLGLSTKAVGIATGTTGVIALLAGGI
ncbi:MAG: MFS transporter, partial [Muribaculaceae bacterium]|nr:MFS transporter [Muribaculaceae bacterium]